MSNSCIMMAMVLVSLFSNAQASAEEARAYVNELGNKTISIISNTTIPEREKETKLTALFTETLDTEWIAKFVLGRYWRTAQPEQQKRYLALYQKFLINSYVPNFRDYTGEKFVVTAVSETGKDEYLVQTEIIHPGKPKTRVDYRLRKSAQGAYKVYDIIAEGVSLISTQRSEFGSIVARDGMDSLLKKLEAKIANPSA